MPTTILVVDDEPAVRQMVALALTREGFRTEQASNGVDALATMEREPAIALIVTDVHMPSMDGLELAERLQTVNPELPVLVMSGDSELAIDQLSIGGRLLPFVRKPVDLGYFIDTVYRVLDRASSEAVRRLTGDAIFPDGRYPYRAFLAAIAECDEGSIAYNLAQAGLQTLLYVDAWLAGQSNGEELERQLEAVTAAIASCQRSGYPPLAVVPSRAPRGRAPQTPERPTSSRTNVSPRPASTDASLTAILDSVRAASTPDFRYVAVSLMAYAETLFAASCHALAADVYGAVITGCAAATSDRSTREHLATATLRLGACRRKLAAHDGAAAAYAAASTLGARLGAPDIVLTARLGQALVVFDRGDLPEAERRIESVIADAVSYQFSDVRARAWHDRAVVAYHRGRPIDAALFAFEAWNLRSPDERRARDRILVDMATFLDAAGVRDLAKRANQLIAKTAAEPFARWLAMVNLLEIAIVDADERVFEHLRRILVAEPLPPYLEGEYHLRVAQGSFAFGRPSAGRAALQRARVIAEENALNELAHKVEETARESASAGATSGSAPIRAPSSPRQRRKGSPVPSEFRRIADAFVRAELLIDAGATEPAGSPFGDC